jgi:hypothetical protein
MPSGPNDEATQFLLDVMHNPTISMRHRINAAITLLEIHGPQAFATRWVTDPRDPSPDPSQPMFKVIIQGIPDGASVTVSPSTNASVAVSPSTNASVAVEHSTSAGVNERDLDPFYVPLLN